jgi:hypothetical protein
MVNVKTWSYVSGYDIAYSLDFNADQVVEFVVEIDEAFTGPNFTIALRDRLNEIIEEEQK